MRPWGTIFTPYGLGERSASYVHFLASCEGRGKYFRRRRAYAVAMRTAYRFPAVGPYTLMVRARRGCLEDERRPRE